VGCFLDVDRASATKEEAGDERREASRRARSIATREKGDDPRNPRSFGI